MRTFRKAPITAECLIICSALFSICLARTWEGVGWNDAQREWGAATERQVVTVTGDSRRPLDVELHGPFDVWDGEWWRVPVSAFHHVNALHLLCNCCSAWALGTQLERRWGSIRFLIFLIPSILIPMIPELLVGPAVGFSGAICSMLGAHLALRQFDDDGSLSEESARFYIAFLVACVWATELGIMPVGNLAHFTGLFYGYAATWVMCGPLPNPGIWKSFFVFAHFALFPGVDYLISPVLNARYHWYLAEFRPNQHGRINGLQNAVRCNPLLAGAWRRLAEEQAPIQAWTTLLTGLSYSPSDVELIDAVRRRWRSIPLGTDRGIAEDEIRRVFGKERGDAWIKQIRQTTVAEAMPVVTPQDQSLPSEVNPSEYRLDRKIDLNWEPNEPRTNTPKPVDPDAINSAGEGTRL